MSTDEPTVVVLASMPSELEPLVSGIGDARAWNLVPILLDRRASDTPIPSDAGLWIFRSGAIEASDAVSARLRARPDKVALLVLGDDPAPRASPTVWFPSIPEPALLESVIAGLLPRTGSAALPWRRTSDEIVGNSPATRQLLRTLDQLAPAQTSVLITGESGVGKELVARALHFCSPRAAAPFLAINCASIPANLFEAELFGYQRGAFTGATQTHVGAFEAARGGTLFLDEIGEVPLALQAKLLRVIETSEVQRLGSTQSRKITFRLVTATNRLLETEVREGRFREDLYYRIHVYPVHVAPLRERLEDIPLIAAHQLALIAARDRRPGLRLTLSALEKLMTYSWPGNVRELMNLLERAALVADGTVIDAAHVAISDLPACPSGHPTSLVPYRDAKARFELDYYARLMQIAAGNVSLAAKLGHKTRKEVYDALKRLGLDATAYRSGPAAAPCSGDPALRDREQRAAGEHDPQRDGLNERTHAKGAQGGPGEAEADEEQRDREQPVGDERHDLARWREGRDEGD
jgi:DNA-binding NtrC family response regulator